MNKRNRSRPQPVGHCPSTKINRIWKFGAFHFSVAKWNICYLLSPHHSIDVAFMACMGLVGYGRNGEWQINKFVWMNAMIVVNDNNLDIRRSAPAAVCGFIRLSLCIFLVVTLIERHYNSCCAHAAIVEFDWSPFCPCPMPNCERMNTCILSFQSIRSILGVSSNK